jgi:hypothetical protein
MYRGLTNKASASASASAHHHKASIGGSIVEEEYYYYICHTRKEGETDRIKRFDVCSG